MPVGIEKINLYAGRFYLDIAELAQVRGLDSRYVAENLMCKARSVYPVYEDAITLAVNAAKKLLLSQDLEDIELLIVGTESAVDMGKPISTWVHRFCNLSHNCRNFEIKHACYGGTAALKMAAFWVASGIRPGKKALVISTDFSSTQIDNKYEAISGGSAVAMLVSNNPQILELELGKAGYWTNEISDNLRPNSRVEVVTTEMSFYSYMDALEGAYSHYIQLNGNNPVNYEADFKKHIYHAPFPGMTFQAHRTMLNRLHTVDKVTAKSKFEEKVAESLHFAQVIGSSYGSSTFIGLLSLLNYASDLQPKDRISLFAYGGGCQGEFYSGLIGSTAREKICSLNINQHLNQRIRLSVEEYEINELTREKYINTSTYKPERNLSESYEKLYENQGFLVLKQVEDFYREYEWS